MDRSNQSDVEKVEKDAEIYFLDEVEYGKSASQSSL